MSALSGFDGGCDLQRALAGRVILQGAEAKPEGEVVPGYQRQCGQNPDLDGADRHADLEVPADEVQFRLVAFQSGRAAAPATVYLQGLMGMAQQSDGGTARRKATGRAVTHAADVVAMSWTAE